MPQKSLTALLASYHDKLDEHTTAINNIVSKTAELESQVAALDAKLAKEDEASGARAGLRDWLKSIRELM